MFRAWYRTAAFLAILGRSADARAQSVGKPDVMVRVALDTTWVSGVVPVGDSVDQIRADLTVENGGGRIAIRIRQDGRIDQRWYPPAESGTAALPWQNRTFVARSAIAPSFNTNRIAASSATDSASWRFAIGVPATIVGFEGRGAWTAAVTLLRRGKKTHYWSGQVTHTTQLPSVTVAPMVVGTLRQQRSGLIGTSRFQELGGRVSIGPGHRLELAAVATPRFAEVEPDEQRINLTRYRLFLPERRSELAGLNGEFDPLPGTELALFHSRRMGFDSLGLAVPIAVHGVFRAEPAGIRVSGFGLLTEETRTQRSQIYGAVRLRKRLGPISVGGLAIERSAPDAPFEDRNRTLAVDGSIGLGAGWTFSGWSALTRSPRFLGGDQAYSVGIAHDGSTFRHQTRFTQVGEFFNPEVGFLTDRGYRRYETDLGMDLGGLGLPGVTRMAARGGFCGNFRLADGFHLTSTIDGGLGVELGHVLTVEASVARRHEGFLEPFAIAPSVTLPRGHYRWTEVGLGLRANSGNWRVDGRLEAGGLYNGSQLGGGLSIDWRPSGWLSLALLTDLSRVRLDQGTFDAILLGSRLWVRPGHGLSLETLAQYNNSVRLWTGNARVKWLDRRGTGVVISFNDAHEADRPWRWVRPQVRSVAAQISKQIAVGRTTSRW